MHVFSNPPNQLDFDDCAAKEPTEKIEVVQTADLVEYPVRPSKFPGCALFSTQYDLELTLGVDVILSRCFSRECCFSHVVITLMDLFQGTTEVQKQRNSFTSASKAVARNYSVKPCRSHMKQLPTPRAFFPSFRCSLATECLAEIIPRFKV